MQWHRNGTDAISPAFVCLCAHKNRHKAKIRAKNIVKMAWFVFNAFDRCLSNVFTVYHPNVVSFVRWNINIRSILIFNIFFSRFFINEREKKNCVEILSDNFLLCWLRCIQYANCSTENKSKRTTYKNTQTRSTRHCDRCKRNSVKNDREKRRWMKMCWPIGMSLSVQ